MRMNDELYKIVYNDVRTIRRVLAVKTIRKFAGLLLLAAMAVSLSPDKETLFGEVIVTN